MQNWYEHAWLDKLTSIAAKCYSHKNCIPHIQVGLTHPQTKITKKVTTPCSRAAGGEMLIHNRTTLKPHSPLLLWDRSGHSVNSAGEVRLAGQIPPQNGSHEV